MGEAGDEGEAPDRDLMGMVRELADRLATAGDDARNRALAELTAATGAESGLLGAGDPRLLSDLLNNLPGSVLQYLLHPDGAREVAFLSPGVSRITGLAARDVMRDPSLAFSRVHPEDIPEFQATIQRSAETLETWTCTYRVRHVDGAYRWALGIGSPRRLSNGATLWNTMNVDVTEQKRAEMAARQRDRWFRAAFDASNVCMGLLEPDGRVAEVNETLARLLGAATPGAFEGSELVSHPAVQDVDALSRAIGQARDGHRAELEVTLEVDERVRTIAAVLTPIQDDDGQTSGILFEGVDVSSIRERARLDRLMLLVGETAGVGAFTIDPSKELIQLHTSSASILEAVPRRETFAEFAGRFQGEDAGEVLAGLRSVASGAVRDWSRDLRGPDDRWFRLYLARYSEADGEVWVGAVQDVTRPHAEQAELRHAQRLEALGRLAGSVAHDFNNLLTAILGSAELLSDDASGVETPLLEEITLAANLGKAMTQRLLTLARKQPSHPITVDLARHLTEALPLWRRMVGEQTVIRVAVAGQKHWVRFDPRLLDQVIMNLLLNARDAQPEGGVIEVQLEERRESPPGHGPEAAPRGWHRLVVRDRGGGMSAATLERALEPFFTTKGGEGTGLGLSTSRAIVEQAGGVLQLDSLEGQGTTVAVWMPRHQPRPESVAGRRAPPPARPGRRVLLVEDDARVRRAVARMLARLGHEVQVADDAEAAERAVAETAVDLVLTDVVMPGVSGPDLAERLRGTRPGLPIVFMSGYPGREVERLGMSPSDPFLAKPFTLADLEAKLAEVIWIAGSLGPPGDGPA